MARWPDDSAQGPIAGRFADVDRAADPAALIGYLASASGLASIQAHKRYTLALLEVGAGAHLLDVGCGRGDEVRALAAMVGPSGRAVGVDRSAAMIAAAKAAAAGVEPPGEYYVGDACALDFPDAAFDACRAEWVFQHLADPRRALAEMVRVARPGARIVVTDPDWETLAVDHPDQALTRAILLAGCEARPTPWMGRRLAALLRAGGLAGVTVTAAAGVFEDVATARLLLRLDWCAERAVEAGAVSSARAAGWLRDLEVAGAAGRFCAALTAFTACGHRP